MIIACPDCSTRYVLPDEAIGVEGRTVRCAKCRHSWFQDGPELDLPPVPPAAEQMRPEPPVPAARPAQEETSEPEQSYPSKQSAEPADSDASHNEQAVDEISQEPPIADVPQDDPPIAQPPEETALPPVYDDTSTVAYAAPVEEPSSFAYAPPFRPRINRPKMMMIAAAVFAVIALGGAAYVMRIGLPDWLSAPAGTFAQAQPDLVLDFPPNRQDRRTLPNGTEFFGASGTVTNVGSAERSVPSILIVMRDARDRIVYSWEVVPPRRRLGPGESVTINEAVTDVPKSAKAAEIGWKPG